MTATKLVLTHVNGNDNVVLLADGTQFVLLNGAKHTRIFTEADSAALVKELTGIKTAVAIAKLAAGRNLKVQDRVITVLGEDVELSAEAVKFQILSTQVSTQIMDTWPLVVTNDEEAIEFPAGVLDDVLKYLLAEGVEKAPTAGAYEKILFVNALPTDDIEENAAYVLDKADGDKPAGSVWMAVDDEWLELTDDEEEASDDNGEPDTEVDKPQEPVVEPETPAPTPTEP